MFPQMFPDLTEEESNTVQLSGAANPCTMMRAHH